MEIVGRAFFAGLDVIAARLGTGFFATLLLERVDLVDLEGFRATDLAALALFALGRTDFVFNARPLTDDLAEDFRAGVRDVDRLKLFVMGLLTRMIGIGCRCTSSAARDRARSLTHLLL